MFHDEAALGDVHKVCNWEYDNQTAREAATGLVSEDIGKLAWQTDNDTVWILKNHSPLTWTLLGNSVDEKVKASGTDTSTGYLDAKVDNVTIEVGDNKLQVKAGVFTSTGHSHNGSDVLLRRLATPTYDDLQDLVDVTQSAGIFTGFTITDAGSGQINVAAGTGIIKSTNSPTGQNYIFNLDATSGVALTDNNLNWIYIEYNSGSPQVAVTTNFSNIDFHTEIIIGRVYRTGTTLYILSVGQNFSDYNYKICYKDFELYKFQRVSGEILGETGTRNITVTAGVDYCSTNRITTSSIDTSVSDTFTYWYRDGGGGWTSAASQSQINNTNYDDGDGTLGTLTANRYGVHWVYRLYDGSIHIQYGQGDYTLSQAGEAVVPTTPDILHYFGILIGKIIIQQNDSSLYSVLSAFTEVFSFSGITNHNELGSIQGGTSNEYYHLTAARHTDLTDGGDSTLHYHASDRNRSNHTGTQTKSTISDFAHNTTHQAGGGDAIKLDDLSAPDDNTDLNTSTGAHGLMPKLLNHAEKYFNSQGGQTYPIICTRCFCAMDLLPPAGSNWASASIAPLTVDPSDNSILVRSHDDTSPQGFGFDIDIPEDAVTMYLDFDGRRQSSDGVDNVLFELAYKHMPSGSAIGAWSSFSNLDTFSLEDDLYYRIDTTSISLSSWTKGSKYKIQIQRDTGVTDNLNANYLLRSLRVRFA